MKKTVFAVFIVFLFGCVKDPKDISTNVLFDVKVNSNPLNQATFIADNNTRYRFDIAALDGIDIDNDKQVTVSVSDGTVSQISNPPVGSSQTTLTLLGGKGTVFYVAGKKQQPSAILSITLNGLTQAFNYVIKPSEPDALQLTITPANPGAGTDVQAQAFLVKNNSGAGIVSEGLRVDFDAVKLTTADPIDPYKPVPNFANSIYQEQNNVVLASKAVQTNGQKGKITVTATYKKLDGSTLTDSRIVEYK